jgi:hypothetical protein
MGWLEGVQGMFCMKYFAFNIKVSDAAASDHGRVLVLDVPRAWSQPRRRPQTLSGSPLWKSR